MPDKIMAILAEVTGGKSYKAHKYGLDHADRPFIDYGEDSIIWKKTAETDKSNRKYVPLEVLSKTLSAREEQRLTYFLDGSRRVFKVDDIAYTKSGGRSRHLYLEMLCVLFITLNLGNMMARAE